MKEHRADTNQSLLCTHSDPDHGKHKRTTSWLSGKRPSVNTRNEYPSVLKEAMDMTPWRSLILTPQSRADWCSERMHSVRAAVQRAAAFELMGKRRRGE